MIYNKKWNGLKIEFTIAYFIIMMAAMACDVTKIKVLYVAKDVGANIN